MEALLVSHQNVLRGLDAKEYKNTKCSPKQYKKLRSALIVRQNTTKVRNIIAKQKEIFTFVPKTIHSLIGSQ